MSKVVRSLSQSEVQVWGTEEDDMTEGDLGYGLGRRPGGIYEVEVSHLLTSKKKSDGKNISPPQFQKKGKEKSGAIFQYFKHKNLQDTCLQGSRISSYRQQSSTGSNSELSNEDLRQRLHETLGAVFGKATSHTQAILQKTVEQKRSLEKEINALQWEIEFDQNRFKNIEESWTQKYERLNCENAVLKENLKLKTEEIKMLKSENAVLNKQYLEALAILDTKQQKMAQEYMCQDKSDSTEVSGLELNDKEEALAHQRKVSYMLARALEDKDTASKENKNKNLMKENFLKNLWPKTSEFSVLHDPLHSSVQIFNSVGCICSIQQPQIHPNHTRTLKRSHSLPTSIIF
ncbi:Coiled-coil domain-containing protein 125 [Sciurus carolinensis]|uniref:Coiled-coil domain-containing protein 125 n=1 Tax=Sciurus carolinensis TaxID=30640 RepID=A0AA41SX42_SCICA|nr:Coiled-coil domain-containing protein 125 [Sciurus carolinensis]